MFELTAGAQAKLGTQVAKVIEAMRAAASDARYTEQARRDAARAAYEQGLPGIRAAREAEVAARQADLADVEARVQAGYRRSKAPWQARGKPLPSEFAPDAGVIALRDLIHESRVANAHRRMEGADAAGLAREFEAAVAADDRASEVVATERALELTRKTGEGFVEPGGRVSPEHWPAVQLQDARIGGHYSKIPDPPLVRLLGRIAEVQHGRFGREESEALAVVGEGRAPRLVDLGPLVQLAEAAGVRYENGADTLADLVAAPHE